MEHFFPATASMKRAIKIFSQEKRHQKFFSLIAHLSGRWAHNNVKLLNFILHHTPPDDQWSTHKFKLCHPKHKLWNFLYTLSRVTGGGHRKYSASPFFTSRPPLGVCKAYHHPHQQCCFTAISICIKPSQTHVVGLSPLHAGPPEGGSLGSFDPPLFLSRPIFLLY